MNINFLNIKHMEGGETINISGKPGFVKHVFNFDEESKCEILNIIQYAVLALLPIIILNKVMQKYVPEADDEKNQSKFYQKF